MDRRNVLIQRTNAAGAMIPASAYTVTAYAVGAQIASSGVATPITVRAGHGFATGDFFIVVSGGTMQAASFRVVAAGVTATSIPYSGSALTVAAGDFLVNLGTDTGPGTPNFDGSEVTIYSTMDGSTTITQSRITLNATGEGGYWHNGQSIWELVRDTTGTVVGLTVDAVQAPIRASTERSVSIASGVILAGIPGVYRVDVEGGIDPSDNLDTINGGTAGDILFIRAAHDDRTIVLTESGNIRVVGGTSFSLTHTDDIAVLYFTGTVWLAFVAADIST